MKDTIGNDYTTTTVCSCGKQNSAGQCEHMNGRTVIAVELSREQLKEIAAQMVNDPEVLAGVAASRAVFEAPSGPITEQAKRIALLHELGGYIGGVFVVDRRCVTAIEAALNEEREACAKECDEVAEWSNIGSARHCADRIRGRWRNSF